MDIVKCDHEEVEIDSYSALLLDEVIVLASLLDYERNEYISLKADNSFNCNYLFKQLGGLKSYTLVFECEDRVVKKTRLYKLVLRSVTEDRCSQPFGAIQKLKELL